MSTVAATTAGTAAKRFHWKRVVIFALVLAVFGAAANLLGWDIVGWFKNLWDVISTISLGYLLGGIALKTVQTLATGYAWYSILRFAYADVSRLQVVACYAASVALNGILPANLGTLMLLLMLTTLIAAATFAGILAAYGVEKIFFCVIGVFPYLYLFLTVGGSFDIKFSFIKDHPWSTAVLLIGGAFLIYLVVRRLWPRILTWWEQAKEGGQILAHPGAYFGRVFLPEGIAWVASLGVIAVFLAAYDIPVTFHTLMRIVAGNSIANVTSVTPGGAGVNQAFNVASLNGVTNATTATAYSVAQQLVTTAWNIIFAIILVVWAFGWAGGRQLVEGSYTKAKEEQAERSAAHKAKREAKRAANAEAAATGQPGPGAE